MLNDPAARTVDEDSTISYDLTELVVDSTLPESELVFGVEVSAPESVDAVVFYRKDRGGARR